jgi:phage gpG-like protein
VGRNDFKQFSAQARQVIKTLPRDMGKAMLLEASDNFRRQGYEDDAGSVHPWAPRKARGKPRGRTRLDGQADQRYKNPRQRAILVQSGRLRRSPRIVATTASSVTVGTEVPYAQPLQEGNTSLPARPFLVMGKSGRDKLKRTLTAKITACLKK